MQCLRLKGLCNKAPTYVIYGWFLPLPCCHSLHRLPTLRCQLNPESGAVVAASVIGQMLHQGLPHQRPHWTLACKEAAMARREGARQGSMMSPSLTALHRLLCASCCDGPVCDAACTCTTCSTCHAYQAVHDGQSAAAMCQETQCS